MNSHLSSEEQERLSRWSVSVQVAIQMDNLDDLAMPTRGISEGSNFIPSVEGGNPFEIREQRNPQIAKRCILLACVVLTFAAFAFFMAALLKTATPVGVVLTAFAATVLLYEAVLLAKRIARL